MKISKKNELDELQKYCAGLEINNDYLKINMILIKETRNIGKVNFESKIDKL